MQKNVAFENILHDVYELETFLHSVIGPLAKQKLKTGEDILPHIEKMGLKVPASLEGLSITWGDEDTNGAKGEQQTITLVRPGSPEALGFTIGSGQGTLRADYRALPDSRGNNWPARRGQLEPRLRRVRRRVVRQWSRDRDGTRLLWR